jgi:hypothetical protein
VASGKRDELDATGAEQDLRSNQQRIGPLLRKSRKGSIDVEIGGGAEDFDLPPDRCRCRLHLCDRGLPGPCAGSDKQRKALRSWQERVQEPKPLALHLAESGSLSTQWWPRSTPAACSPAKKWCGRFYSGIPWRRGGDRSPYLRHAAPIDLSCSPAHSVSRMEQPRKCPKRGLERIRARRIGLAGKLRHVPWTLTRRGKPDGQSLSERLGQPFVIENRTVGFRVIARKDGPRVRLYSRPGNDLTHRFPLIVETLTRLRSRSCIIDGEAVACDDSGDKEATRLSAETDRGMARRASITVGTNASPAAWLRPAPACRPRRSGRRPGGVAGS